MENSTLLKFGYPHTLIKNYEYWSILLRPNQVTIGSLVLVCRENTTSLSDISSSAALEYHEIIQSLESKLKHRFHYSKINYLTLMMIDPVVHTHIIPRYQEPVLFCDQLFGDEHWPGQPDLSSNIDIDGIYFDELLKTLKSDFSSVALSKISNGTDKKYKKMYTSGCFDIFHQGHLNILKQTKQLCDYLIVGVSTDELILASKGRLPVIPFHERISIIESIGLVDEVIPQIDKNKQAVVDTYNIDAISVGSDWRDKYPAVTCDLVYFEYTPNVSSTILKKKLDLL